MKKYYLTLRQESIRTADKSLAVLAKFCLNHLCYRKNVLISIEALICGYFEPKKLRAGLQKKAATEKLSSFT